MEYKCKLLVRYHECDMYGHVNHAVYLNYLEWARIEMLKSNGISIIELAENGCRLFVIRIAIDYKSPAQFNAELEISTSIVALKKTGGVFKQIIKAGEITIAEAEVQWACVNQAGKPARIPETLKSLLL